MRANPEANDNPHMANIELCQSHALGKQLARQCAERIAGKLKNELNARYEWQGDDLIFNCAGAKGAIRVSEQDVRVEVELAFLLRPMRAHIEKEIRQQMLEALT